MPVELASSALSRFTVLDLTRVRSGPICVRELADWGANVIKIETPPGLVKGEALGAPRDGADFQNLNRNKRSMTLDLKSRRDRDTLLRMAAKAEVIVENFRPDVKDRPGINYEAMRKINKRIVYSPGERCGSGCARRWNGPIWSSMPTTNRRRCARRTGMHIAALHAVKAV
jgi:crotonobetainyl-CoA:carnitine CoA-transferase CaiB-like acyl-CoA transferase